MRTHNCPGGANTWCAQTWPAGPCITSVSPLRRMKKQAPHVSCGMWRKAGYGSSVQTRVQRQAGLWLLTQLRNQSGLTRLARLCLHGQHTSQCSLPSHLRWVCACQPHICLEDFDEHRPITEHCQSLSHAGTVVPRVLCVTMQAARGTKMHIHIYTRGDGSSSEMQSKQCTWTRGCRL